MCYGNLQQVLISLMIQNGGNIADDVDSFYFSENLILKSFH